MRREGIEYIELRGVDVNPYIPEGISINNIKVLDLFLMHSLISESPFISDEEANQIRFNHVQMVENGRSDNTKLTHSDSTASLADVRVNFHEELILLAAAMDEYSQGYSESLAKELSREKMLSQKIMDEMKINNMTFQEYGLNQSKKVSSSFRKNEEVDMTNFIEAANKSLKELKILEETTSMDINKYVELYNSKLKEEK